jgi:competence protein ComEA
VDDLEAGEDQSATWDRSVSVSDRGLTGWLAQRGVRIDPGRRGALAVGLVAVLAAVVTGGWVLLGRAHTTTVPSVPVALSSAPLTGPSSAPPVRAGPTGGLGGAAAAPVTSGGGATAAGTASGGTSSATVVVDVVGRVRRPGVYRLAPDARVIDAVRAAGGLRPGVDASQVNLARRVSDGEQIAVGVPGASPAPAAVPSDGSGAGSGNGSAGATGPVDLNTASLEALDALPGVGPVLAQHILDWRAAHGQFTSVDQLDDVPGIGPSKFAELKPLVTL